MKEIDKYKLTWSTIIDELYLQNEEFDYKKVKKIHKRINTYYKNVIKKIEEINTTLKLTEFNDKEAIKKDLVELLNFLIDMEEYLQNFIKYEPNSKIGYYNYLKSIIPFI